MMAQARIGRRDAALGAGFVALVVGVGAAQAEPPKTMDPGKLHVALNGDMPMTELKDGKLIGTDGELMVLIAERLGLEVVPHMMEWSAEIQSTKQGKVDIMHGAMGWIAARSEIMLLTDPIYYFGTLLAQKKDTSWSSFEDMQGRSVATVSGFTLVPELKEVEGIGEVKLYDTTDGALHDLIAGRVDMAILDPPLMQLAIPENPDWNLHQVPLAQARPVPDHVAGLQRDLRHQPRAAGAPRRLQPGDRQDLGRLHQRQGDGQVRPGRQGLVHAAAPGGEPADRRRPAEGLGGAERRPLLLGRAPGREARPLPREAPRSQSSTRRLACPPAKGPAPAWSRSSGSSTCTRASARSRSSRA